MPSLQGLKTVACQAYFVSTSLELPANSQLSYNNIFSNDQVVLPNLLDFCLSLYGITIALYRHSLQKIWCGRRDLEKRGHRTWSREVQAWDGKRWGIGWYCRPQHYKQLTDGQLKKCKLRVEQNHIWRYKENEEQASNLHEMHHIWEIWLYCELISKERAGCMACYQTHKYYFKRLLWWGGRNQQYYVPHG